METSGSHWEITKRKNNIKIYILLMEKHFFHRINKALEENIIKIISKIIEELPPSENINLQTKEVLWLFIHGYY